MELFMLIMRLIVVFANCYDEMTTHLTLVLCRKFTVLLSFHQASTCALLFTSFHCNTARHRM